MDSYSLAPDGVENMLVSKNFNWSVPITCNFSHMDIEWNFSGILHTKRELQKMHLHFFHPSGNQLFNLITRAKPEQATPQTKKIIERSSEACATCQRFTPKAQSFQVSVPGNIKLSWELALDFIFLDKLPVLHVGDTHIHLISTTFLKKKPAEAIGYALLSCWATLYTSNPDKLKLDRARQFTSAR